MKIAIVGSHGSGKTTFCNRIKEIISETYEVMVVPDIARHCPFPVGTKSTLEAQQWILDNQLYIEKLTKNSDKVVIFDNHSVGHLSYFHYWGGLDETYFTDSLFSLNNFQHVLYLPHQERFLIDDGLRPTDPVFQSDIARNMLTTLNEQKIKYTPLPTEWPEWQSENWLQLSHSIFSFASNLENELDQVFVAVGKVKNNEKFLLNRRHTPNIPDADGTWEFPGGRLTIGENPATCVEREVFEETGYIVQTTQLLPIIQNRIWERIDGKKLHVIVLCYECKLLIEDPLPIDMDFEARDPSWYSREEARKLKLLDGISEFLEYK